MGISRLVLFAAWILLLIKLPLPILFAELAIAILLIYCRDTLRGYDSLAWGILGGFTFIIPALSSGILLSLVLLLFLFGGELGFKLSVPRWSLPILVCILVSVLGELAFFLLFGMGSEWIATLRSEEFILAMKKILSAFRSSPPSEFILMEGAARLAIIPLLWSSLREKPELVKSFCKGVWIGVSTSACILFAQIYLGIHSFVSEANPYWEYLNRFSGGSTDPNALGVAALLSIPLAYMGVDTNSKRGRLVFLALFLSILVIGAFSGSRTFFLGVALLALFCLSFNYKRATLIFALVGVVGIVVLNLLNYGGMITQLRASLPEGPSRALGSILLDSFSEQWSSRAIFLKIAFRIFLDNPISGVGFMRFDTFVPPYAEMLGLGTGIWSDNANNFYLGVLAELGLIGGAALLFSFLSLSFSPRSSAIVRYSVPVFCLLLFFGPHIYFDEIAVLFGTLLGVTTVENKRVIPKFLSGAGIVCVLVLFGARSMLSERGFYSWEKDDRGRLVRWTSSFTSGRASCVNGEAILVIRSLHPPQFAKTVGVRISPYFSEVREIVELGSGEEREVKIDCRSD